MFDGVYTHKFEHQQHTDELFHVLDQPTETTILERNSELRKNDGVISDLGAKTGDTWGRQVASIPFLAYQEAIKDGYDLNNTDASTASKEMFRFLQSEKGKQCLVRSRV